MLSRLPTRKYNYESRWSKIASTRFLDEFYTFTVTGEALEWDVDFQSHLSDQFVYILEIVLKECIVILLIPIVQEMQEITAVKNLIQNLRGV